MTTQVNRGFRVTSAKFHPVAISFCSLVTLHLELQPADVPFDFVEQHLIVARGSVAGLRGLNLLIDTGMMRSAVRRTGTPIRSWRAPLSQLARSARWRISGTLPDDSAAGVRKLEFPPARREVQSCQRTHRPRRIGLVADEVVGDHQDRGDR